MSLVNEQEKLVFEAFLALSFASPSQGYCSKPPAF